MGSERADLGFGDDALEDFNPADWNPDPGKTANDKPKSEDTKKAAEAAGFQSREPKPAKKEKRQARRHRTGRDTQFNMKAKKETIEAFYDLSDANGWVLGKTLEKAVELLQKEYGKG